MSQAASIYNLERGVERELEKAKSDPNGDLLLRYYQSRVADGLSLARIIKCMNTLRMISKILKIRFDEAVKEDVVNLVADIERRDLSESTKLDYKKILKQFFRWLKNCEDGEYPPEVKWLRHFRRPQNRLTKSQLLTEAEVKRLVEVATNIRDKALIQVILESGRRIGEVLSLRMDSVYFDEIGVKLLVDGKTGTDFSRLIASAPALANWLDNHPARDDPGAPVWVAFGSKSRHKQLSYAAARSILKDCALRAGMKKRVYFHLFRHTRATQAATRLNQMQMCSLLGWKVSSRMPAVYVHLSGEDIDEAQSIMNGVKHVREKGNEFQPKRCGRCGEQNAPISKFCIRCGSPLELETAVETDQKRSKVERLMDRLAEDPDKLDRLLALVQD